MAQISYIYLSLAILLLVCVSSLFHARDYLYEYGISSSGAGGSNKMPKSARQQKEAQNDLVVRQKEIVPLVRQSNIVPLFDWEIKSMVSRECRPPKWIPRTCCIGTLSAGGDLGFNQRLCNNTSIYHDAHNYTVDYLQNHAHVNSQQQQQPCDVCRIVELLLQHNLTLSFQGDSMTRQTFSGLECDLHRRGYRVETIAKRWADRASDTQWRIGITDTVELSVQLPLSANYSWNQTARIVYYAMYRPAFDNLEVKRIIDNSDIVVFDHGLHWCPIVVGEFRRDTTTLLRAYVDSNLTMVAWRQTSSQHFPTVGGHWIPGAKWTCGKMDQNDTLGYHWLDMVNASKVVGLPIVNAMDADFQEQPRSTNELVFLPYREYTAPLHYMHAEDCSHYCSTPYIWLPIWRSLRFGMDRAVPKKSS